MTLAMARMGRLRTALSAGDAASGVRLGVDSWCATTKPTATLPPRSATHTTRHQKAIVPRSFGTPGGDDDGSADATLCDRRA